jgi:hypothetical protein
MRGGGELRGREDRRKSERGRRVKGGESGDWSHAMHNCVVFSEKFIH